MISHTGPTKPALVLLCCIGTWLTICSSTFVVPKEDIKEILARLKFESKELYKDYSKNVAGGMEADELLQLPCFTLGRQALANISVIKAYLEKAKVLSENRADTTKVTKWLVIISCTNPLKLNVSGPADTNDFYARKTYILTVLKRFSDCMAELKFKDSVC